jgi:predicted RNA-binding Zn-ribbon protein involved in translation (DUF1610 family)
MTTPTPTKGLHAMPFDSSAQYFSIEANGNPLASAIGFESARHVASMIQAQHSLASLPRVAPMPTPGWEIEESDAWFRLYDLENYAEIPVWLRDTMRETAATKPYFFPILKIENGSPRMSYVAKPEAVSGKRRHIMDVVPFLVKYHGIAKDYAADMFRRLIGANLVLVMGDKPATFAEIYNECQVDHSCMDKKRGGSFNYLPHHPAYVYGAGDIGIAWLEDTESGESLGRTIFNKKTQQFSRTYARDDVSATFRKLLRDAGLVEDSHAIEGCKLLAIETDSGGWLMPYLDGIYAADMAGEYFVARRNGQYRCDSTSGEIDESESYTCDHCGDRMRGDDSRSVGDEIWCDSCADNYSFYCEKYQETYPDSDGSVLVISRRGSTQTWCDDAARQSAFECEDTGEWYDSDYYTQIEVTTKHGSMTVCEDESPCFFHCEKSGGYFHNDDFTQIDVEGETWCKEETSPHYCAFTQCYYQEADSVFGLAFAVACIGLEA